jgi:hypothetical protein
MEDQVSASQGALSFRPAELRPGRNEQGENGHHSGTSRKRIGEELRRGMVHC